VPTILKSGSLSFLEPSGLSRPVMELLYLYIIRKSSLCHLLLSPLPSPFPSPSPSFLLPLHSVLNRVHIDTWLTGKHSHLSLENKLLIYKTVLKPVWTYGIELWGCATKSNIAVIQRYQSKLLRTITNAPWYVSNQTLHSARPHGIPGTGSYSSHDPGLAPPTLSWNH